MFQRYMAWTRTFKGALCWAVFCLFALFMALAAGSSTFWVVADAACCVYWVLVARKALKFTAGGKENDTKLTPDQTTRIKEATDNLATVLGEVDRELTVTTREKARVQSDQRTDQEAGAEGTDGRTDSKEDR